MPRLACLVLPLRTRHLADSTTSMTAAPPGGQEVLLGRKLRGFGEGRIVAVGGHVEPGESPTQAARRELREEVDLVVAESDLDLAAVLRFSFPARPEWDLDCCVYRATRFTGHATRSDEIDPRWVATDSVPWEELWDDGHYWLPVVLRGARVSARIDYDLDNRHVARARVDVLDAHCGDHPWSNQGLPR